MPACFVVMCVSNDVFRSLCPGSASVESSMSSVKGFSGPASEKIKLFFIGHRRRSAVFLMLTWDAGWYRSACSACSDFSDLLATLFGATGTPKRSGSAVGPCAAPLREVFAQHCGCAGLLCAKISSFEAVASVLQDASTSRVLALGFGWHRRDRLRPRDTRTSLHLTPAPATPSLRAETLRRASHQLPRADDRDSDSD